MVKMQIAQVHEDTLEIFTRSCVYLAHAAREPRCGGGGPYKASVSALCLKLDMGYQMRETYCICSQVVVTEV